MELHAYGKNVEKLFTVRPGASVDSIRVQLDGADSLSLSKDGALDVETESGLVRFTPPIAWQEKDGKKLPVQVAYVIKDEIYGFKLGQHDASLPVIIDPLLQSTYLGGGCEIHSSSYKDYSSIAIHPTSGEVYLAGTTCTIAFPGVTGGAQVLAGGSYDGFVARLSSDLTVLLQSSFIGGLSFDGVTSLAIHPISGDVYLGGDT